jgi:hypothetical protein
MHSYSDKKVWTGLAGGVAGGLLASWAMNQYQALWKKVAEGKSNGQAREPRSSNEEENATTKAASAISEKALGHKLRQQEKKPAATAVHYAVGTAFGAAYGVASELAPKTTLAAGLPFGAAVWLVADEITVPLLGWAPGPTQTPVSIHAQALTSHLVYGAVTDGVRRLIRKVLT